MSDRRDDADQEMVSAGIASGMEDTLGVSTSSSSVRHSLILTRQPLERARKLILHTQADTKSQTKPAARTRRAD